MSDATFEPNPSLVPKTAFRKRKERVIDARICVLSGCRFLRRETGPSGETICGCAAGVYRAELPYQELREEIQQNPSPVPGHRCDENPFLLRLLMSPECVRPECGVAELEHSEKVLVPDPQEAEEPLFAD